MRQNLLDRHSAGRDRCAFFALALNPRLKLLSHGHRAGTQLLPVELLDARAQNDALEQTSNNTHGHIPGTINPAVSSNPHIKFIFWIACPTIPLPRLSVAENTLTRLVRGSTDNPMWHMLVPSVC